MTPQWTDRDSNPDPRSCQDRAFPLSYPPIYFTTVPLAGIEPAPPGLEVPRSTPLSYRGIEASQGIEPCLSSFANCPSSN